MGEEGEGTWGTEMGPEECWKNVGKDEGGGKTPCVIRRSLRMIT